jgi:hypothetical protein
MAPSVAVLGKGWITHWESILLEMPVNVLSAYNHGVTTVLAVEVIFDGNKAPG